jgi:DNA-binding XRE family transcriptional regulator
MTPADLRTWRREMGFTQVEAARSLTVPIDTYRQYEAELFRGTKRPTSIPSTVALACAAVKAGILPYEPSPGVEVVEAPGPGRPRNAADVVDG